MSTDGTRAPRADAERNRTRILDHAAKLLAADPDASMVQIAEASGVGRATLYRHFASREEVIEALRDRAFGRAQAVIVDALTHEDHDGKGPTERLRHLIAELLGLDDPYGLIADQDPHHHREAREAFEHTMLPLIEEAQRAGELTSEVSPLTIGLAFEGLMLSANRGVTHEEITPEEAIRLVELGIGGFTR